MRESVRDRQHNTSTGMMIHIRHHNVHDPELRGYHQQPIEQTRNLSGYRLCQGIVCVKVTRELFSLRMEMVHICMENMDEKLNKTRKILIFFVQDKSNPWGSVFIIIVFLVRIHKLKVNMEKQRYYRPEKTLGPLMYTG